MSRLNTCGFDMGIASGAAVHEFASVGSGTNWAEHASAARTGAYGLRCLADNTSFAWVGFRAAGTGQNAAVEAYFVRFYFKIVTLPTSENRIALWQNPGTVTFGISLRLTTTGALRVFDTQATPSQIGSDSSALSTGTWYRIELKTAWTNNEVVARYTDGSGTTTFVNDNGVHNWGASGGIEACTEFRLGSNVSGGTVAVGEWYFDDFAWNDEVSITGPVNQNSYPGAGNVVQLDPNADGNSNLGAYTGAGTFADVAENPPDTTTYWTGDVANDTLEVNATASGITGQSSIPVVQVGNIIRALTAAAASYASRIRSNATSVNGTTKTHALTTFSAHDDVVTTAFPSGTWYVDPNGSVNWTVAAIDALQIGLIAIDATPDLLSTKVWAMVEYVPTTEFPSSPQTVTPNAITSGASVPSPTVTPGGVTVTPNAVSSGEAVFSPQLNLRIFPGAVATGEALFAPTLTPGGVTVTPSAVATGEQVFSPTITGGGGATVTPDTIATGAQVFSPTVAGPVIAAAIASGEQVHAPTVTGGEAPAANRKMTRRWYAGYLKGEGVETPRHRVRLASYGSGVRTPGAVDVDVDETSEGTSVPHRVAANLTRFTPGESIPDHYKVVSETSGESIP